MQNAILAAPERKLCLPSPPLKHCKRDPSALAAVEKAARQKRTCEVNLLLHRDKAKALDEGAFNLANVDARVERLAHIHEHVFAAHVAKREEGGGEEGGGEGIG